MVSIITMKKVLILIGILALTWLIWALKDNDSSAHYAIITSKISEDNSTDEYLLDIEYPKLVSNTEAYQFVNDDIAALVATSTVSFVSAVRDTTKYRREHPIDLPGGTQSNLYIRYRVATGTPEILPVIFMVSEYHAGAAHPNTAVITRNYDLRAGVIRTLDSLFVSGPSYLEEVALYAKEELTKKLVADGLPEEAVWLSGAEPGSDNYTAWFAGADGLHILFQQYQVAPYAYGIPEVTIPWNKLKSLKQ